MTKVVLTGFEPWAHGDENPTLSILDRLGAENSLGFELITRRVPVESAAVVTLVAQTLDRHRPDIWISLGLAPGATVIAVERLAANVLDFPVPDSVDHQPICEEVFAQGPMAYPATLPIKAIVDAVQKRGIPVKISNTASTYLCNQIMYTSLHLVRMKELPTRCGFIHVPFTPDYVAKQAYPFHEAPSMSLDLMVDAGQTAVEVTRMTAADIAIPPKGY